MGFESIEVEFGTLVFLMHFPYSETAFLPFYKTSSYVVSGFGWPGSDIWYFGIFNTFFMF